MTVAELIAALEQAPPDARVLVWDLDSENEHVWRELTSVASGWTRLAPRWGTAGGGPLVPGDFSATPAPGMVAAVELKTE